MFTGHIYRIENVVNHKMYIGQTVCSVEERWRKHISASHCDRWKHLALYRAMRKYGEDNFIITELCSVTKPTKEGLKDTLNSLEIRYIKEYCTNLQEYGYNLTDGGDVLSKPISRQVIKVDRSGCVVDEYDSLREAELKNNMTHSTVWYACRSKNHYSNGSFWFYADEFDRGVKHIDIPTQRSKSHPGNSFRSKAVVQLSKGNQLLNTYKSSIEASNATSATQAGINKCCRGARKTSGGYKWMYAANFN